MAKMKLKGQKQSHFRAWFILAGLIGGVSVATAASTVWIMSRQTSPQTAPLPGGSDPLSVAEREGTFRNIKAALRWPNLNFGIEGSALIIEGTADSDAQIETVIALVKKSLKADSFYIVHPYIQRPDWISGRVEAMREGDFDYKHPNRSVLIVNLMKTGEASAAKARVGTNSLEEAQRILAEIPAIKDTEDLRVEPIPRVPETN